MLFVQHEQPTAGDFQRHLYFLIIHSVNNYNLERKSDGCRFEAT